MQLHQAQLGRHMCQGLFRVATALMATSALPCPDMPFNSELTRFEQRFGSFGFLQRPAPLIYDQYAASMDASGEHTSIAIIIGVLHQPLLQATDQSAALMVLTLQRLLGWRA